MEAFEHVTRAQDAAHGEGHDYDKGSPHLRHPRLRSEVQQRLRNLVAETIARTGNCRVLEIGAGHGTFTSTLVGAGAEVTVTETSRASADELRERFHLDPRVTVAFDETGGVILESPDRWDLVVIISVLHHIPDYVSFLSSVSGLLSPGGGIFTVQDPLYYPRRSGMAHRADRFAYLSWRVFQGDYGRGLSTRLRRVRGVYSALEPSDLVEYHVVRDGVDEEAIRSLLTDLFADVEIFTYWSSQAPFWQRLGDMTSLKTTFGVSATGRR